MTHTQKIEAIRNTAYHYLAFAFHYPGYIDRPGAQENGVHCIVAPRADRLLIKEIYNLFGVYPDIEPYNYRSVAIYFPTLNAGKQSKEVVVYSTKTGEYVNE